MEQSNENKPAATVLTEIRRVAKLLRTDPAEAAEAASGILDAAPGQQQALIILVSALRLLKQTAAARELLEWMAQERPKLASVQYELGILLAKESSMQAAIERLSTVVELEPNHGPALRALGNQLSLKGDFAAAGKAYAHYVKLSIRELKLLDDLARLGTDELVKMENALRSSLDVNPTDVMTLCSLANVYVRLMRFHEAQTQLARALELAPDYQEAREHYAWTLNYGARHRKANEQFDILAASDPARHNQFQLSKVTNLVVLGDYDEAFELLENMRGEESANPGFWLNYGHALRTVAGRTDEAIGAYRECLKLDPAFGTAWSALANLKTYRFSTAEIETMEAQAARDDLRSDRRAAFHFSLGQALEDRANYAESFEHYRRGNSLLRPDINLDATVLPNLIKTAKAMLTPEFFATRAGLGCPSRDPIFIVGMARAGSTLIEQILSSHSLVEGTRELPDISEIVAELQVRYPNTQYPQFLRALDGNEWEVLGKQYLEATQVHRKLGRPHFTDKAGTNFMHVGLIQLILPNARIIDARRHPLGCSFSCYKQVFPVASMPHSYDLKEMAQHYRGYVELMAHYDRVLPGRIHRVYHEDLVRDPEKEVRRLLAYCGLQFEEQCLRFYESDRAVRTVSAQQVRKPIDSSAGEKWRRYEPWLGPAKEALGDVLAQYPNVPEFD